MSETPPEISPHHELPDDNFKWSEDRLRRLIRLVKHNRILWDHKAPGFVGIAKRVNYFTDIAEKIGTTAYECNRRFTSLRERFGREARKVDEGSTCFWPYYKELEFLKAVIRRRDQKVRILKGFKKKVPQSINTEEMDENEYESENSPEDFDMRFETAIVERKHENHENEVYLIEQQPIEQEEDPEEQAIDVAFKYFKVELNKMDYKKREYCIDKMMLAFVNAKTSYPK